MRTLIVFFLFAILHFVLSVAGLLLALPAAFESQAGFWSAPGKVTLVWISSVLLAPLDWMLPFLPPKPGGFDFGEIAIVSVLFGIVAAGIDRFWLKLSAKKRAKS